MKMKTLTTIICFLAVSAIASGQPLYPRCLIHSKDVSLAGDGMQSMKPTYLPNVSEAGNWRSNWFLELKGGASAFLGTPIGCGDVFDRMTPAMQVGIGKWFIPEIGCRIEYQGFQFKNAQIATMNYHLIHADFLCNLTSRFQRNEMGISRWDLIPFFGFGLARNADWVSACGFRDCQQSGTFAFSYGIQARYRLNKRFHLQTELSGMTTSKNFDAVGVSHKFQDHLMTLTAGISVSLGRVGYRRVLDPKPYIIQNTLLRSEVEGLSTRNRELTRHIQEKDRVVNEYQKILELEGLLDRYKDQLYEVKKEDEKSPRPRNDYSGLNHLKERIGQKDWNGMYDENLLGEGKNGNPYLNAISDCQEAIGIPIYFFFRIGSDELTDVCQLLHIEEIARIAKKYNLNVKIIGAADSATGSVSLNETLSIQRAEYIKRLLTDREVEETHIHIFHEGGINTFQPIPANRNTCITLSL